MLKWEEDQVYISVGRTELLEEETWLTQMASNAFPVIAPSYTRLTILMYPHPRPRQQQRRRSRRGGDGRAAEPPGRMA